MLYMAVKLSNLAPVAQWIRRVPTEHEILGSIPGGGIGRLAQMVERSLSMREARGSIPRLSIFWSILFGQMKNLPVPKMLALLYT